MSYGRMHCVGEVYKETGESASNERGAVNIGEALVKDEKSALNVA